MIAASMLFAKNWLMKRFESTRKAVDRRRAVGQRQSAFQLDQKGRTFPQLDTREWQEGRFTIQQGKILLDPIKVKGRKERRNRVGCLKQKLFEKRSSE